MARLTSEQELKEDSHTVDEEKKEFTKQAEEELVEYVDIYGEAWQKIKKNAGILRMFTDEELQQRKDEIFQKQYLLKKIRSNIKNSSKNLLKSSSRSSFYSRNDSRELSDTEKDFLKHGVVKHGEGSWDLILEDLEYSFSPDRTVFTLMNAWSDMREMLEKIPERRNSTQKTEVESDIKSPSNTDKTPERNKSTPKREIESDIKSEINKEETPERNKTSSNKSTPKSIGKSDINTPDKTKGTSSKKTKDLTTPTRRNSGSKKEHQNNGEILDGADVSNGNPFVENENKRKEEVIIDPYFSEQFGDFAEEHATREHRDSLSRQQEFDHKDSPISSKRKSSGMAEKAVYTPAEIDILQEGISRYGEGNWRAILNHGQSNGVFNDPPRTVVSLKDKWRSLTGKNSRSLQKNKREWILVDENQKSIGRSSLFSKFPSLAAYYFATQDYIYEEGKKEAIICIAEKPRTFPGAIHWYRCCKDEPSCFQVIKELNLDPGSQGKAYFLKKEIIKDNS
eukprot:GHVP01048500.1.p1 GENE.GHVP01048500.1~~GHVP01048500.1.p1  ORF type:complete len:509 (+),score=115.65 GHVP01048500.1:18-1544(+)